MAERLWTWDDLVRATAGEPDGVPSAPVTGFSIDTRTLAPGDIFVALKDVRDGHDFVPQAFANGASAALVSRDYRRQPGDGALLRLDAPLSGLERIGIAARNRLPITARVIAVTGSAGKTGTKEMLRASFAAAGKVHASDRSFNNHWGVPLTLARMPADTEFGVFEIGMNHAGEIRPLTRMVRPHIAIITNVLPVHVGNFPDGETGVANAKAEIFDGLEPGGFAILPKDNPHFERLRCAAESHGAVVRTFGTSDGCDVRLASLAREHRAGKDVEIVTVEMARSGARVTFGLGMLGEHLARNALAVIAALETVGKNSEATRAKLAGVASAQGRGARLTLGAGNSAILLLDDSYNANPASMRAALLNLASVNGRRVAVMGDMLELGHGAAGWHTGLADALDSIDLVFACGANMRLLFDELPPTRRGAWAPTSTELIPAVLAALRPGDAVMVKGSLGSRMAPIVDAIKKRFAEGGDPV